MKIEDLYEGQPVALIRPVESLPKGSIGFVVGYSGKRQSVLINWEQGSAVESSYVNPADLLGVLWN